MALGRRTCGNIRVSAGSASGYDDSASFFSFHESVDSVRWRCAGFFLSLSCFPSPLMFFLSQNAGAEWKFGDRDFCQVCYLSLNTSRYSEDPFANFDHQRCRRSQKLALSQKGLEKAAPQGKTSLLPMRISVGLMCFAGPSMSHWQQEG